MDGCWSPWSQEQEAEKERKGLMFVNKLCLNVGGGSFRHSIGILGRSNNDRMQSSPPLGRIPIPIRSWIPSGNGDSLPHRYDSLGKTGSMEQHLICIWLLARHKVYCTKGRDAKSGVRHSSVPLFMRLKDQRTRKALQGVHST